MITPWAHSHPEKAFADWHPLATHLRDVAEIARDNAQNFGAGEWAHTAGLWHDLGKYSNEFQTYLRQSAYSGSEAPNLRIDHSTAGAQHAVNTLQMYGRLIAYAIAGHHAGLPDGVGGAASLDGRLKKSIPVWDSVPEEISKAPKRLDLPLTSDGNLSQQSMRVSLFVRMLFSCLVDADFLDTELFMSPARASGRLPRPALEPLYQVLDDSLKAFSSGAPETVVNKARREVLNACRTMAEGAPGIYSLNVPTGGGKTLSSLAFGLRHAVIHNKRRVIYAIPFTSIIEQNAQVFRDFLGSEAILEHHSNFDPVNESVHGRLSAENWDAPVVVTTNVQFFESFFANRTSACRKLHRVAGSVIILDEAQALPIQYLHPCLKLLEELVSSFGCTVVICSATQPAIEQRDEFPIGLSNVKPIIKGAKKLFSSLRRARVTNRGKLDDGILVQELNQSGRALCIVNTRRHAHDLFDRLGASEDNFHLSALMCPAHRSEQLECIRRRLSDKKRCIVVSTQLIEAGVDLDFPIVYRAMAGLDSIAQAAGRCNREGGLPIGETIVFEPEEAIPPGFLRHAAQAAREVLGTGIDALSPEAIEDYFRLLYWQRKEDWDKADVMKMLEDGFPRLSFPFRTIAEKFQFITDGMDSVIVPWSSEVARRIAGLRNAEIPPAGIDRYLQRYVVTVSPHIRERLPIETLHDRFHILANMDLYDCKTGLNTNTDGAIWDVESLIV
jgi:CRISPR-associated endonuclease/helicase Cas3